MMIMALLKCSKIILVSLKHLLPESEHWHIGFPRCVGEFLVSFKLKHDFLDEVYHSNNVLFMLNEFLFSIPPHLREKTISVMSVKNFECPFHILFQHFLYVNFFLCPYLTFGPLLELFYLPQLLDMLVQTALESNGFLWHIICCFHSSGTWSHIINKDILTIWQIACSVPTEPDQWRHLWYLHTLQLDFISYG